MLRKIIEFSLLRRPMVLAVLLIFIAGGFIAFHQLNIEALISLLQKVFLTKKDRLAELVPTYWVDCLSRKVDRRDKHSAWECETSDQQRVPDFEGKKILWDLPLADNSFTTV